MGTVRARNSEEIENRKQEILAAAEELFIKMEYQDITLAIISQKTSISRPSMYNYYRSKEEVFLDLSKREYLRFGEAMKKTFSRKVSREQFCQKLTDTLWQHQTFLKVFSLHSSIIEDKCGREMMYDFKKSVQPFFTAFSEVLEKQFPGSDITERDLFKAHFFMYAYSLYPVSHIPPDQIAAMNELKPFGDLPSPKELFTDALLLLTSVLK